MRLFLKYAACILSTWILFNSCQKKLLCPDCDSNLPPLSNAGADQTITLPKDSVLLDGGASSDADGIIITYKWTKIGGPAASNIVNSNSVKTPVKSLVLGVYRFELMVTDNGGLITKDTVQITVRAAVPVACNDNNRTRITAQLIPIGMLSMPRSNFNIASAGSKIIFAGGSSGAIACPECWGTPRVDIYDTITRVWSTATLSKGRWGIATVSAGNKIFFAGGEFGDGAFDTLYNNIDIYDAVTNSWSIATLSERRSDIGAAVVGDKVFFAGGENNSNNYSCTRTVDIYNLTTNGWSIAALSTQRAFISAITANNKIFFAGGNSENRNNTPSEVIDIYDNNTNTWTTSTLQSAGGLIAGITLANKIYWTIGCKVEILNVGTNATYFTNLSKQEEKWFQVYGQNILIKDNKLIFLHNNNREFDIYDITDDTWSIGVLPRVSPWLSALSVNNSIYVCDGSQVWKLEF